MKGEFLFERAEERLANLAIQEACALFTQAEQAGADPDTCAGGRWVCHMLAGNFEEAWQESDAISRRGKPDANRFWNGEPLAGKRVLVRCLHGLGDTIQFIRYAPLLRKQTRALIIEAQPSLKELMAQSQLADEVITWDDPEPPWDQQIEVVELPRIFRTNLSNIPHTVPYLCLPPCMREDRESQRLQVGLVWASGSHNPARSVLLHQLAELLETRDISFISLQGGEERCQGAQFSDHISEIENVATCIQSMAQCISSLDLVISVDTMAAHLAGALAKPVWVLLPFQPDWRWMLEREDSPWYPTMRLFRQPQPGDWESIIRCLRRELEFFAKRESSGALTPLDFRHCKEEGGTRPEL